MPPYIITTAEDKASLEWLRNLVERTSQSQAAALINISTTVISRLLKGEYKGDVPDKLARIAQARENEMSRQVMAGAGRSLYIETSLALSVRQVCDYTRVFASLNTIIGHSQIGKTTALRRYTEDMADTYMVTFNSTMTISALVRMLARSLGCKAHRDGDLALAELASKLSVNSVIIVDEVHQAAHRASGVALMEFLRSLHDLSHCGIVLCGTYLLESWMRTGKAAASLEQLINRGTMTYLKSYPMRSDLDALAQNYGLPALDNEAYNYASEIIKREGLGPFCRELERASYIANRTNAVADWEYIMQVMESLAHQRTDARGDRKR